MKTGKEKMTDFAITTTIFVAVMVLFSFYGETIIKKANDYDLSSKIEEGLEDCRDGDINACSDVAFLDEDFAVKNIKKKYREAACLKNKYRCDNTARYLHKQGNPKEALKFYKLQLKIYREKLAKDYDDKTSNKRDRLRQTMTWLKAELNVGGN